MLTRILVSILLAGCAHADEQCTPVSFPSVRSAVLAPSPTTHRVLVREGNSYTAYEVTNSPPFSLLGTIPEFEKELSACIPPVSGFGYAGVLALARTPSGGYIFAMAAPPPTLSQAQIAVFDAGMHLVSEAAASFAPLAFADLNGDGNSDMIGWTYSGHNQVLAIALGTGDAGFQPPVLYHVAGQLVFIRGVAVADVNGDHKPDLVVVASDQPDSGQISVFLGNGDGTFQPEKIVINTHSLSVLPAMAVADLNRDGNPDMVFTSNVLEGGGAFVSVALGAGDGTFSTPVAYAVAGTEAVAIGDVNGDGIPDIVTSGITVLLGDGKGGFSNRRDFLLEPRGKLIVTDFDGDGMADVVVATGDAQVIAGDAVSVLHGLGNGAFAGPPVTLIPNYPAVDTLLTALVTADVNGDGIPDLASADNAGHVAVLKGIGDGTFQTASQFMLGSGGVPSGALFADFNRDGKLDLAVVESGYTPSSTAEIDIMLGNGDGTFQSPSRILVPLGAFALAPGDFNRDGNLDLAVLVSQEGAGPSDGVQILLGNGNGTFNKGAFYVVGPYAHSIAAGDFNGDGKLDLVVTDAGTYAKQNRDGNIALLIGKGDGTFQSPVTTSVTGGPVRGPYSLVASDFNRDGKLDLAFTLSDYSIYEEGLGLMIVLGRGDGTFQAPVNYAVDAFTVQAGDLNGDGIPDLILAGHGVSPGIRYMLGTGDGAFRPALGLTPDLTLYASAPLALADFNRDSKLDIAAIGAGVVAFLNSTAPAPAFTVVSAADFTPGPIAAGSIATAFGKDFATASGVSIEDSTGTTLAASILFASPSQINFVVPAGLDTGPATVTIGSQTAGVALAPVAPSLFILNEQGLAAACVTVESGNAVTCEPVVTMENGVYAPVPIDLTSGAAFLSLFGTGFRNATNLRALVNGSSVQVVYAGPQPSFAGLDQVNLLLPASLSGSGCSNLAVSTGPLGLSSNTVYICIR